MTRSHSAMGKLQMSALHAGPTAFLKKLARRAAVNDAEAYQLLDLLGRERFHAAGERIVRPDVRAKASSLLIAGLAARTSGLESGAEAITQVALPGDFIDLASFLTRQTDQGVIALTDCCTRAFSHNALVVALEAEPRLARLLWLETVIQSSIQREWLFRMGRQDALGRLAHFLCEMRARLEAVGIGDSSLPLPLTQGQLGDVLGLTGVHVNRVIAGLRDRGLVAWREGQLTILNEPQLRRLAEFDPAYLRLGVELV